MEQIKILIVICEWTNVYFQKQIQKCSIEIANIKERTTPFRGSPFFLLVPRFHVPPFRSVYDMSIIFSMHRLKQYIHAFYKFKHVFI